MQTELLRILRKKSVTIEYLSKELGRSKEDIEAVINRIPKLVKIENGIVSLK